MSYEATLRVTRLLAAVPSPASGCRSRSVSFATRSAIDHRSPQNGAEPGLSASLPLGRHSRKPHAIMQHTEAKPPASGVTCGGLG
jgi:hypothetical protein